MIASKLKSYLEQHQIGFQTITHEFTGSSMHTAETASVPGDQLAKAVIVGDEQGFLMVVIPADYYLDLAELNKKLHRALEFIDEQEFANLFPDCDPGAVPPIGPAYGLPTIWDTKLGEESTVYVEAGDHETLLQLSGRSFHELMAPAERGHFSRHM